MILSDNRKQHDTISCDGYYEEGDVAKAVKEFLGWFKTDRPYFAVEINAKAKEIFGEELCQN